MTTEARVSVFDESLQKAHDWLRELETIAGLQNQAQAYSVLRTVLHALRDRLSHSEAVDLAAQLPLIIRGFYYEGWKPSATPTRHRTRQAFFDGIRSQAEHIGSLDPAIAVGTVFKMLNHRNSEGEISDIRHVLQEELRDMWPIA